MKCASPWRWPSGCIVTSSWSIERRANRIDPRSKGCGWANLGLVTSSSMILPSSSTKDCLLHPSTVGGIMMTGGFPTSKVTRLNLNIKKRTLRGTREVNTMIALYHGCWDCIRGRPGLWGGIGGVNLSNPLWHFSVTRSGSGMEPTQIETPHFPAVTLGEQVNPAFALRAGTTRVE